VDFRIGRALLPRAMDVLRKDTLSAALDFSGDGQQRLQLTGNRSRLEVALDL